jgi:hypothetical protein
MTDQTTPTAADLLAAAPVTPSPAPAAAPDPAPAPAPAAAAPAAAGPASPAENPLKDSNGTAWHPSKYRLKDGKPQLDTRGRFVPQGLGRKAAPKPAAAAPGEAPAAPLPKSTLPGSDTAPASELAQVAPAALTAEVAINLVQAALIMIGEDEGILTDAEKIMLAAPLSKIIQKYNLADQMTPELEAGCVVAMIVLTRLKKPKTQTWFQGMLLKCRGFIVGRKIAAAVPEHQQSPAIAPPAAANP